MTASADVAATFCATLVDEWVRCGLRDAVVSPGSRSTPVTLALLRDDRLRVHTHPDERSAAFVALGLGSASGRPAIVVCTSGTAAAELHPAVVEAHEGRVPLLVVTTDRPPELRGVGAPQTIDQTHLYQTATRWFADPGVPDASVAPTWRSLAARAVLEAQAPVPGPVHLNLPFREPLLGAPGALPSARDGARPWHRASRAFDATDDDLDALAAGVSGRTGVIVAGGGVADPHGVHRLAQSLGWPVVADPRSGCRVPGRLTVSHADAILREPAFARAAAPEVVLRLGDLPASKVLATWLAALDAWQVGVHAHGAVVDPDRSLATLVAAEPGSLCARVADRLAPMHPGRDDRARAFADAWCRADAEAASAITSVLARHAEPTEPAAARAALAGVPAGGVLVVGASMPIRDVEWYGAPRDEVRVIANRGANGIDGVVSTAVGVALDGAPTVALLGDLTLLHDTNGLLGLCSRSVDLTLVVVDNDGGGIFSFLPQGREVPHDHFEVGWGTPHGVDIADLVGAHRLPVERPGTAEEVTGAIATAVAQGGPRVVHVPSDRAANVEVHAEIHAAVASAVAALPGP